MKNKACESYSCPNLLFWGSFYRLWCSEGNLGQMSSSLPKFKRLKLEVQVGQMIKSSQNRIEKRDTHTQRIPETCIESLWLFNWVLISSRMCTTQLCWREKPLKTLRGSDLSGSHSTGCSACSCQQRWKMSYSWGIR